MVMEGAREDSILDFRGQLGWKPKKLPRSHKKRPATARICGGAGLEKTHGLRRGRQMGRAGNSVCLANI